MRALRGTHQKGRPLGNLRRSQGMNVRSTCRCAALEDVILVGGDGQRHSVPARYVVRRATTVAC